MTFQRGGQRTAGLCAGWNWDCLIGCCATRPACGVALRAESPSPLGIIDTQTVPCVPVRSPRGDDAAQKVLGRRRAALADADGTGTASPFLPPADRFAMACRRRNPCFHPAVRYASRLGAKLRFFRGRRQGRTAQPAQRKRSLSRRSRPRRRLCRRGLPGLVELSTFRKAEAMGRSVASAGPRTGWAAPSPYRTPRLVLPD